MTLKNVVIVLKNWSVQNVFPSLKNTISSISSNTFWSTVKLNVTVKKYIPGFRAYVESGRSEKQILNGLSGLDAVSRNCTAASVNASRKSELVL